MTTPQLLVPGSSTAQVLYRLLSREPVSVLPCGPGETRSAVASLAHLATTYLERPVLVIAASRNSVRAISSELTGLSLRSSPPGAWAFRLYTEEFFTAADGTLQVREARQSGPIPTAANRRAITVLSIDGAKRLGSQVAQVAIFEVPTPESAAPARPGHPYPRIAGAIGAFHTVLVGNPADATVRDYGRVARRHGPMTETDMPAEVVLAGAPA